MRLLWLPDKLRAYGLPVVEHTGWRGLGESFPATPQVAIGHHTATSARAHGDLPTLRILTYGRSDLPGPLCQVALSRSGVAHVIAAGKANHAGRGEWLGIKGWPDDDVNQSALTIGCEVEHPGTGPWPEHLLGAFDRVMAAMLDGIGQPATAYCGHREWALPRGRKVDPTNDLDAQRARIQTLLDHGPTRPPKPATATLLEEDDMPPLVFPHDSKWWLYANGRSVHIAGGMEDVRAFIALGARDARNPIRVGTDKTVTLSAATLAALAAAQ